MAVLNVTIGTTGQVPNTNGLGIGMTQQTPTLIYISTNDTLATVTTAGYLNESKNAFQYPYNNYQLAEVYTTDNGTVILRVSVSGSTYSLVSPSEAGVITSPTVTNQIAYATNTLATLAATGLATALFNAGNISAGLSGTAGTLSSFPAVAAEGKLTLAAVSNSSGNFNTTINNASAIGQSQAISIIDSGAATANFILSATAGAAQSITAGNLLVTTGNLQAGSSGHAGTVASFPATAAKGSLLLVGVANTGNTNTTISNAAMGQASVVSIPDPGAATAKFVLDSGVTTMAAGSQIVLDKGTGTESSHAVTINKQSGVITTTALTTAGGATETVTLTNSEVATTSVVVASIGNGTNSATNAYTISSTITGANTVVFVITNTTAATALNGTLVISFAVF